MGLGRTKNERDAMEEEGGRSEGKKSVRKGLEEKERNKLI